MQPSAWGGCGLPLFGCDRRARLSKLYFAWRSLRCAAHNDDLLRFEFLSSHLAGLRPAGSHCENSGKSDDTCASARSDRAKSAVFRDRSANAGVVARYFSPCLIFWCFWIKPKAQEKSERRKISRSILWENPDLLFGNFLRGAYLPPFVTKRWRQKCPQGEKLGERPTACA